MTHKGPNISRQLLRLLYYLRVKGSNLFVNSVNFLLNVGPFKTEIWIPVLRAVTFCKLLLCFWNKLTAQYRMSLLHISILASVWLNGSVDNSWLDYRFGDEMHSIKYVNNIKKWPIINNWFIAHFWFVSFWLLSFFLKNCNGFQKRPTILLLNRFQQKPHIPLIPPHLCRHSYKIYVTHIMHVSGSGNGTLDGLGIYLTTNANVFE